MKHSDLTKDFCYAGIEQILQIRYGSGCIALIHRHPRVREVLDSAKVPEKTLKSPQQGVRRLADPLIGGRVAQHTIGHGLGDLESRIARDA